MPTFSCPKCKKVLKTAAPLAPGKKIKCPGCANVFAPPADDDAAVQATPPAVKPVRKPAPPPPDDDDEDEAPPRRPVAKAKTRADEDEEDDDDEAPARRTDKKKAGSKKLIYILGGVGVLLILFVLTAFVWPGFLVGNGKKGGPIIPGGPKALDPLAFVPNNSDFVFGANLGSLRDKPEQMKQLEDFLQQKGQMTPEQLEIFKNADRAVAAGSSLDPETSGILVFTSVAPLDAEKVRKAFGAGAGQQVEGKTLYQVANAGPKGRNGLVAMPDNKTVVVGSLAQPEFVKLLEGKNKLPVDLQTQANTLRDNMFWGVVNLEGLLADKKGELMALAALPGGQAAIPALQRARLGSISLDAPGDLRLQIDLQCADDKDATQVQTFANSLWNQQAKPFLGFLPLMAGNQQGIILLVDDVGKNFKIERQGPTVSASVTVTEKTMKELEKINPEALLPPEFQGPKKKK